MKSLHKLCILSLLLPAITACPTAENNGAQLDCIQAIELCDPNDSEQSRIILYNQCDDTATPQRTCPEDTVCEDNNPNEPGAIMAAMCVSVEDCGEPDAQKVCDPERPNDVYFADECGNLGLVAEDCMDAQSSCIELSPGQATCACDVLPETRCKYPRNPTNYYEPSFVVRKDTCGNEIIVEQCEFGSRCYNDESGAYNNGEARCERSLDASQASSPYYDYGCFFFDELTRIKTSLAADCRCRAVTMGGGPAVFVETSTMTNPTGKLPNCQSTTSLLNKTLDPPLGSGPQFNAWGLSGTERWYGSWLDPQTRKMYGLVTWTDPRHRASGALVSFEVDTGVREVISGIYPDVRMGEILYGSGYESPNDIPTGPATQPLSGVSALRPGPGRQLYTLGVGTTGEGQSRSAEIVRINPETGERTLVWQSQTTERGTSTAAFGQCISDSTPDTLPDESVVIVSRSFAVDDQGAFFMSFYDSTDGTGIIKVSADGSTCEFITRFNAGARDTHIGTGYTPQTGARFRAMLIKDGAIYTPVDPWGEFMRIDLATGNRIAVSIKLEGNYNGMGLDNIIFDETRQLFYTIGGPASYGGGIIEESTGTRQNPFGDNEFNGLIDSAYDVRRDVTSFVGGAIVQDNFHGTGPFALDPDDPDIAWFVLKGGALLKMEWSTFNNMITSY